MTQRYMPLRGNTRKHNFNGFIEIAIFNISQLWLIVAWWRHMASKIWPTLVQVMACYLMVKSHHQNQCWLIVSNIYPCYEFENHSFKITAISPKGQWVASLGPVEAKGHPKFESTVVITLISVYSSSRIHNQGQCNYSSFKSLRTKATSVYINKGMMININMNLSIHKEAKANKSI